jgi:hypothetical protein
MKSESVTVNEKGEGIAEALAMTEKVGKYNDLERKPLLHLRLLAEEMFGMLHGIAGEVEASYWIENEANKYELHMKSEINMTFSIKDQLLAVSSSGKNEASRSFMGKIRAMIGDIVLSSRESMPYAVVNTAVTYPMGAIFDESSVVWSMAMYKEDVQNHLDADEKATEAWDELEKSIVANIADDVKVKIVGDTVEMIVIKSF